MIFRPDHKDEDEFRNYDKDCDLGQMVKRTYLAMHTNQTVEFVKNKVNK